MPSGGSAAISWKRRMPQRSRVSSNLGSGRQQRQRKRGQKLAFVAVRNQTHAGESAGGADGGIGIAGQRQIGLHSDFAGAPRDRRGDILRKAEKSVESRHVEGHGIGPVERTVASTVGENSKASAVRLPVP